jgi:hypothetical protein
MRHFSVAVSAAVYMCLPLPRALQATAIVQYDPN